jgi:predicted SAM-dependent methyltransferase
MPRSLTKPTKVDEMTRVNIGCGPSPTAGWLNLDNSLSVAFGRLPRQLTEMLERLGALGPGQAEVVRVAREVGVKRAGATSIPLRDASAEAIYSSHMLEHLDREDARMFLSECHRVLRPGGWLRLVVPDIAKYVNEYATDGDADNLVANLRLAQPRASGFRRVVEVAVGFRGHRWMYDATSLSRLVSESGFIELHILDPGETHIPDPGALDLRERADDSVYLEAQRP